MNELSIIDDLQAGVVAAVASTGFAPDRVKYVGLTFDPPSGVPWLEVVILFTAPAATAYDGKGQKRGTMRLILHAPSGVAAVDAAAPLTSLAAKFNVFDKVGAVQISNEPYLSSVIETATENLYPLNVRFEQWKN